jgi:sulfur transfer complex TusBCD TusB component (DsrH family)
MLSISTTSIKHHHHHHHHHLLVQDGVAVGLDVVVLVALVVRHHRHVHRSQDVAARGLHRLLRHQVDLLHTGDALGRSV